MTKILQALMQLESRAESPIAPPAAAAAQVESSVKPVASPEPPAVASPRNMVTEIAPRSLLLRALERQPESNWTAPVASAAPTAATPTSRPVSEKKRALRRARKAADAAARALDTTAEIEALLSSLQPSVQECWSPTGRPESVVLEELPLDLAPLATTAALTCDQLPSIVTPVASATPPEVLRYLPRAFDSMQVQSWAAATTMATLVVEALPEWTGAPSLPSTLVNDQTPQVVHVTRAAPAAVQPRVAVEVADLLAAFTPAQVDSFVPTVGREAFAFPTTTTNTAKPAESSYTIHLIDQTPEVIRLTTPEAPLPPAPVVGHGDYFAAFQQTHVESFTPSGTDEYLATSVVASVPIDPTQSAYTVAVNDQTPAVIRIVETPALVAVPASATPLDLAGVFAAFQQTHVQSFAPEHVGDLPANRIIAVADSDPSASAYVCDINDQTPAVIRIVETPAASSATSATTVDLADIFAAFQPTWVELSVAADFELPLAARSLLTAEPDQTGSAYVYDINDQTPEIIRVAENPSRRAVEFDELLAAFEHTVVDSYSPENAQAHGIETAFTPIEDNPTQSYSIECRDQVPVVIEIPRIIEVPAPPTVDLTSQIEHAVIDAWTPDDPLATDVYSIDSLSHEISGDDQVVVHDQLPEVIFLEAVSEPVEIVATLPEVITPTPASSLPRTRPTRRSLATRQRHPKPPDQREAQMRTAVRGPRQRTIVAPSAWETTIRDEISAAPAQLRYAGLIERWQSLHRDEACRRLLVVSLEQHLAAADAVLPAAMLLAGQGSAVLVIDADEQAELTRRLNLAGSPGLCELLSPEDAHGETIHPTATPRLHVLPLGRAGISPLAIGSALPRILGDLAEEYTWILVSGGHADAPLTQAFARACQGTYVAAPLPEINLPLARESLARLRNAGARVLGSIVME